MNTPKTIRDGRRVERISADFSEVTPLRIAPNSADILTAVAYNQLDQAVKEIQRVRSEALAHLKTADASIQNAYRQDIEELAERLAQMANTASRRVRVARMVERYEEALVGLEGVVPSSDADNPDSWILVANFQDLSRNGIWSKQLGGLLVRPPLFSEAESYYSGLLVFDDYKDAFWQVTENVLPLSATNLGIAGVKLAPFGRAQDITATGFLRLVANELSATVNDIYLGVVDGRLTLRILGTAEGIIGKTRTSLGVAGNAIASSNSNLTTGHTAFDALRHDIAILDQKNSEADTLLQIKSAQQLDYRYFLLTDGQPGIGEGGELLTIFEGRTYFGTLNFEIASVSRILAPYTQLSSLCHVEKAEPDAYHICFRGQFPNNQALVAIRRN